MEIVIVIAVVAVIAYVAYARSRRSGTGRGAGDKPGNQAEK